MSGDCELPNGWNTGTAFLAGDRNGHMLATVHSLCAILLLFSCSSKELKGGGVKTGPLEQRINETLRSSLEEKCDKEWSNRKLMLARAVDRYPSHPEVSTPKNGSVLTKTLSWGPVKVEDDSIVFKLPEPKTTTHSWQTIWEKYKNDETQFVSSEYFRSLVSRLAFDDWRRLARKINFVTQKKDVDALSKLYERIDECRNDYSRCEPSQINQVQLEYLRSMPSLNERFELFLLAKPGDKAIRLGNLLYRLKADYQRFNFMVNPTVKRLSKSVLELPMVGDALGPDKQKFSDAIEPIWRNEKLAVKIRWIDETQAAAEVFRIALEKESNTFTTGHKLEIGPTTTVRSMAHEIGHVLGLQDAYYTFWDAKTCAYITPRESVGIMSRVQYSAEPELEELDRRYPAD